MRDCRCEIPIESPNPRREGSCVRCGFAINEAWSSNNKTVAEFFGRLKEAVPFDPAIDPLIAEARRRELGGRRRFGNSFHGRENWREGCEEAADGALYAMLQTLVNRRKGESQEIALALTAAHHFAKAHEALRRLGTHDVHAISDFAAEDALAHQDLAPHRDGHISPPSAARD